MLFVAAGEVHSGALTAGSLIAYLLFIDLLFSPVQQLSQVFDGYQQANVGLQRIKSLLRTRMSTPAAEHPVTPGRLRGQIELRDVGFRYQGQSQEALNGVASRSRPARRSPWSARRGPGVDPGQAHRPVL